MNNWVVMTLLRYLHPHGAVSFWHTPLGPSVYDFPSLDDYYIDLRAKLGYRGPQDSAGIPMLNYFGPIGIQYNPCAVAQWGLGGYQAWRRDGSAQGEGAFRGAAQWLRDHLEVDTQGRGFWWYRFDFDAYGLRAPWASALAQAQGLALLLRAHRCDGDAGDLTLARQACAAMLSPVAAGGLLLERDGMTLLEEVVADRPTAILDGLIFAVFGLQDYCFAVPDDGPAAEVLGRCVATLKTLLPRYDLGCWSRADLYSEAPPMPASAFYHGLHVAQLTVLAQLTGEAVFADYAERWRDQMARPTNRLRAFASKLAFKFSHY
jgi:hypothetical protein